jgi:hypothetical protein
MCNENYLNKQRPTHDQVDLVLSFTKALKKNKLKSSNYSKKVERDRTLTNSFHEARITLISKPDKNTIRERKLKINNSSENSCNSFQQIANFISISEKIMDHDHI